MLMVKLKCKRRNLDISKISKKSTQLHAEMSIIFAR